MAIIIAIQNIIDIAKYIAIVISYISNCSYSWLLATASYIGGLIPSIKST